MPNDNAGFFLSLIFMTLCGWIIISSIGKIMGKDRDISLKFSDTRAQFEQCMDD